ncbi:major facilitator superfamily domain-containing protein 10-like protein [Dinothrombium tinctorium]|uniref:Major facilitator superfamily domain-containing protein 10-like protein n=1 Tax=Dinothrombium tinctorium TaxID=1965070 RepID=A0A3S3PUT1_9ACAR|nr:major facilitator superfamily domain-containing protein 10-like protein [Dinothrombium tinctorium]RWS08154.1 major facilitator superfamily domain-containing protein 10-like protein [Dinothrombium tinctorium]RWS16759.1 major facilitator superfamily domain-containing protein 10-like protein [Dinothrombium tinctorium]
MQRLQMHSTCFVVCTSLVIDLLAFTLILPLFPSIFDHYSREDESGFYRFLDSKVQQFQHLVNAPNELNKVLFSGLLGSWFSLLQFLCSPFIGAFSDVFGRRVCLLFSLAATLLSHMLWSLSGASFALFFVARTVGGLSKANVSLTTAIVTDVTSQENRSKAMALIGASFSVGFIVGPLLGAILSQWSTNPSQCASIVAIALTSVNLLFVFFFFSESLSKERRAKSIGKGLSQAYNYISPISLFSFNPVQNIKQKDVHILRETGWIYFLYLLLYSGLEYSLSFLTHLRFHFSSLQQGKMYFYCGLIMILVQGTYVRIAAGHELRTAAFGLLLIIPAFVLIGISTDTYQLFSGLALYSFSSATVVPCLTTIASSNGPVDQKGTILGIFRSLGALARALGPILSAILFWKFGSVFCYCGGGFILCIPLLYLRSLKVKLNAKKDLKSD